MKLLYESYLINNFYHFSLKNLKKRNNNLNENLFDDKKITSLLNEFISLKVFKNLSPDFLI